MGNKLQNPAGSKILTWRPGQIKKNGIKKYQRENINEQKLLSKKNGKNLLP